VDENENGPLGVIFKWMEGPNDSDALRHITEDGGFTYQQYSSYIAEVGVEVHKGALETDPDRLVRLHRISVAYQQELGETVFSV
jgi:hypothetical protein